MVVGSANDRNQNHEAMMVIEREKKNENTRKKVDLHPTFGLPLNSGRNARDCFNYDNQDIPYSMQYLVCSTPVQYSAEVPRRTVLRTTARVQYNYKYKYDSVETRFDAYTVVDCSDINLL
jgi:hypothetical protein